MQKTALLGTGYWGKRWKCKEQIALLAVCYDSPNRRNDDYGNNQNMMLNSYNNSNNINNNNDNNSNSNNNNNDNKSNNNNNNKRFQLLQKVVH